MTSLAIAVANGKFKGKGAHKLCLLPYPTVDLGADTKSRVTAILDLWRAATPFGTTNKKGVTYDAKERTLKFDFGDGSPDDTQATGWESAKLGATIHEVDPAHLANFFGVQAADLTTIAASATEEGRSVVVVGNPNTSVEYIAVVDMPSALGIGASRDVHIWPRVSFLTDPKLTFTPDNPLEIEFSLQCKSDYFLTAADGSGVLHVVATVTAPKTA
jgi:hypothetical protein